MQRSARPGTPHLCGSEELCRAPALLVRRSRPSTLDLRLINFCAVLAAFLTTILFSISVVCGHRSAKMIGGTEANFWRLATATLLLGIWSYGFRIGLGGTAFPLFLVSGIMGIGIGDVALFQALPRL